MVKNIKIYGRQICTYCVDAKEFFESLNLDFDYIDVSDEELKALEKQTGIDTIPQIFVGDKFIGGWLKTKDLYEKGELQKLLKLNS